MRLNTQANISRAINQSTKRADRIFEQRVRTQRMCERMAYEQGYRDALVKVSTDNLLTMPRDAKHRKQFEKFLYT